MVAAVFAAAPSVYAQQSSVHDVDISVKLTNDGSALITEVWSININYGTEWYLVRSNLGDIEISDFKVSDEMSAGYIYEGSWNVDRSLAQKAYRCGIVEKRDGCELCWGLGSYGSHTYIVEYRMSNVVKAMKDYDKFHLQLVSPGIQPRPEHVYVRISAESDSLHFTEENTGIWAFGFEGTDRFTEEGTIEVETELPFEDDRYSVIVLARFEKGMFSPTSVREKDIEFQTTLDNAFEGSDYKEFLDQDAAQREADRKARNGVIAFIAALAALTFGFAKTSERKRNQGMFGVVKLKEIGYARELPFDGNLFETRYVLGKCSRISSEGNMATALILKMIKDGQLTVYNNAEGYPEIGLSGRNLDADVCFAQAQFFSMIREAAGPDGILQKREFSRWSRYPANQKLVTKWVTDLPLAGASFLQAHGYGTGTNFTPAGQEQARRVIGFRNFLKDFTLLKERETIEVALWQDYLIYAALFGIADKVAKELQDINPRAFEEVVGYPYPVFCNILYSSNSMGNAMVYAVARQTSSSAGGHGGFSSFGGGGGFSGGGFGGGAR